MTSFTISQLCRLYHHFGLLDFILAHNETELLIGTGHFDVNTGNEKCYRIHPQELFPYSLTRMNAGMMQEKIIDTYFGGDYAHWTHGHWWFMGYLDNRYASIISHVGISRFLPKFLELRDAIERYMQKQ